MSANLIILQKKRAQRAEQSAENYMAIRAQLLAEQEARIEDLLECSPQTRQEYFQLCEMGLKDVFPPTVQQMLRAALL